MKISKPHKKFFKRSFTFSKKTQKRIILIFFTTTICFIMLSIYLLSSYKGNTTVNSSRSLLTIQTNTLKLSSKEDTSNSTLDNYKVQYETKQKDLFIVPFLPHINKHIKVFNDILLSHQKNLKYICLFIKKKVYFEVISETNKKQFWLFDTEIDLIKEIWNKHIKLTLPDYKLTLNNGKHFELVKITELNVYVLRLGYLYFKSFALLIEKKWNLIENKVFFNRLLFFTKFVWGSLKDIAKRNAVTQTLFEEWSKNPINKLKLALLNKYKNFSFNLYKFGVYCFIHEKEIIKENNEYIKEGVTLKYLYNNGKIYNKMNEIIVKFYMIFEALEKTKNDKSYYNMLIEELMKFDIAIFKFTSKYIK
eukprot:GAHX01002176.1.p1 GENE.GAHX01002176.1~~GAHX01002176.1.p1  ORF type:complete len:363 (-),score=65.85 GAHX01002176.1:25-1113(-)